jgi:hypothetical protein
MDENFRHSHDVDVCTGKSHKQVVKLTVFRGGCIKDPKKFFNSSLERQPIWKGVRYLSPPW